MENNTTIGNAYKVNKKLEDKYNAIKKRMDCSKHISSGKCSGDCCGVVPIPKKIFKLNRNKIKDFTILDFAPGYICVVRNGTLNCAFLTEEKTCAIYDQRPAICKLQGNTPELPCPHEN